MEKKKQAHHLPKDPNSYSNPDHAVITHFHLEWTIDFQAKIISGSVLLNLSVNDSSLNQFVLDSRDLTVSKVICEDDGQELTFEVGTHDANFGSKLTVSIPLEKLSRALAVRVFYATSPASSGLQWLRPELTSGKRQPFLFSQCQAIHARSLMPCQDTPRVKATYSASVTCQSSVVALMSALREEQEAPAPTEKEGLVTYKFRQPVAIPSYLLALVVGDLTCADVGPRSKVWAEPEVVKAAAREFAETEEMLKTAEMLCGPYIWTQYDLLVLPPSFPYGGMENPCLTFVTPTLLAGDGSLVDVIAHEICHSWTGNLVTNCSWEHFWLNEGFTVFLERKVKGRLRGPQHRHLSAIEGWDQLKGCIETRGANDPLTRLVPKLEGVDPDDAFSSVPYEKGHAFLWYLEELLGGPEEFEPFLKAYLEKFRHQSIDTSTFRVFLGAYFSGKAEALQKVDWDAWLHTPGMPPFQPQFDTTLADACSKLCNAWKDWDTAAECPFTAGDLDKFSTNQVIVWLSKVLDASLPLTKVRRLTEVYRLAESANAEVKFRWLRLCLQARWGDRVVEALAFINAQARMKFVRPIYRDLYQWEATRKRAIANFQSQKGNMMHVCVYTISKDLHLGGD